MEELVLFYYFCWFIQIFVFFFMQPSRLTKLLHSFILIYICVSPYFILVDSMYISFSYIILFLCTFFLFGLSIFRIEMIIITFMCMIGYVGLLIWEKLVPILLFIPSKLWIGIIIICFVRFLLKSFHHQMIVIIIGFTWGQLMYEIILIFYRLDDTIGNYKYMNYLFYTIVFLVISKWFSQFVKKVYHYTKVQFYTDA